jgi:hypothetical protein
MDMSGTSKMSRLLVATLFAALLQLSVFTSIHAKVSPAARLYIVGGGQVEALDALTLAPLPPSDRGVANRLRGLRGSSQLVQSPDGSKLGIIRRNAGVASHSTLTIVSVGNNTVVRKDAVSGLTLLGVSNDGQGWYGVYTAQSGRVVHFVSARAGRRHALVFHLLQPCCVLFQYDSVRDRLYVLALRTVWNAGVPESSVITAWQVSSRQRVASLTITGLVGGTRINSTDVVPVDRAIPGFALSSDGRMLAVLDFANRRLDTIDALRLRWTRNPFVSGWGSGPEITLGPSSIPSPRLSGVEGFDIDAHFSLDGKVLYEEGTENNDHKKSTIFPEALTTRAINVSHSALRGAVSAPLVAPLRVGTDGSSVYTAVIRRAGAHVSVLVQRRRSADLSLIAEHTMTPFAKSYLLIVAPG